MRVHEYQAKALFQQYGIASPRHRVATSPDAAATAYKQLKSKVAVVKAQVHAGGRGKAGGVKLVKSTAETRSVAKSLLGRRLVTAQTGSDGQPVTKVLVEEGLQIAKEYYVGVAVDRAAEAPVLIASREGGMNIEEVAVKKPDAIVKERIDPRTGLQPCQARAVAYRLGFRGAQLVQASAVFVGLSRLCLELDASLVEINPLIATQDNQVLALDGKIVFDGNALFRHPELRKLQDPQQEHPIEVKAAKVGLNYVGLDGNIGCMVNGAGLAMATMDLIKLHGGWPANFLDVGGGASVEQVRTAFQLILSDKKVKSILVNIFGGIMQCDVIAQGIIAAVKTVKMRVPLVVRLEGTNVEQGRELLAKSGIPMVSAGTLDEAAEAAVAAAKASSVTITRQTARPGRQAGAAAVRRTGAGTAARRTHAGTARRTGTGRKRGR